MSTIAIKSVCLRGCWNLETINDECPICRNSVLESCVECSGSACECVSVMGLCEHIYHLHCIEKWTKTKNSCPLDNKKWEYKKPNICQVINSSVQQVNTSNNLDISGNNINAGPANPAGIPGPANPPGPSGVQILFPNILNNINIGPTENLIINYNYNPEPNN